jgi:hypothetical protein
VTANKLIYASMTKTDIAIYQLTESYDGIYTRFHVRPYLLSRRHPEDHSKIEIVSGYWKIGYTCGIDYFVYQLKEYGWVWEDSIRYTNDGCHTKSGTSGAPILYAGTREIIGINNTGNESGEACTMNNPCEIDQNGNMKVEKGTSYGQQTYWIYSCLNSNNQFDLTTPGCELYH